MKTYNGGVLPHVWEVYIKVDGVNLFCKDDIAMTKDGNCFQLPFSIPISGHYELFEWDWGNSVSLKSRLKYARPDNLFSLDRRDPRLFLQYLQDPNEDSLERLLRYVVSQGHEGLVLKKGKQEYKVKPYVSSDVRVTGIKPGTGRNKGRVGSLITAHGNVLLQKGDDKDRFKDHSIIGSIIEAKHFGWTEKNKMRHARFLRERPDKNEEHLERVEDKYVYTGD